MMPGTQVAGNAIDQVFNQSVAPARRFRSTIDAALTLALGSVCAFGLTLGPAPMNTVALSSAEALSVGGTLEPEPGSLLPPVEVEDNSADELPPETFRSRPPTAQVADKGVESATGDVVPGDSGSALKEAVQPQPQPQRRQQPGEPAPPSGSVGPFFVSAATALSVVEQFRIASGLSAFVSPGDCPAPVAQTVVTVTPSLTLPPGLAKKSMVPDPAYATAEAGPGALVVTIHSCQ